jgi:DNA polymerase-1
VSGVQIPPSLPIFLPKANVVPKLTLIDGSGFIFRAYHALPPLRRPDGIAVGAVYGFCSILLKTLAENKTDALAVVFDANRQTFRQTIYAPYKAHRPDAPEDLVPQFAIIREACAAFHVACMEAEGFEADDIIATYAHHALKEGYEVCIISSDKDLMQLVKPGISMLDPIKNKLIGEAEVLEKFGVSPDKVIEVQALAGDASDNIPGIPGIGIKTAAELINIYGNIEALLSQAHKITQPKRREALIEHAEKARISRQLVILRDDSPLPLTLDALAVRPLDYSILKKFLTVQGFTSLVGRIDRQTPTIPYELPGFAIPATKQNVPSFETPATPYEMVTTLDSLKSWVNKITQHSIVAIDCETTSLNAMQAELVGISLAVGKGDACYIPLTHQTSLAQLDRNTVLEFLAPCLVNRAILKVGHNIKYDLLVLGHYGTTVTPITDTMLMSYVLDAGKNTHGMDALAELHLGYKTLTFAQVAGSGKTRKTFDQVPLIEATAYAAEDADITLQLYHTFYPRLIQEKMVTVFERFERPLVPLIAAMERHGIRIDRLLLDRLGQEFSAQMTELESTIYKQAGRSFNIGSPKQLGEILFDELNLTSSPGGFSKTRQAKKTKTGAYVTDVDVLENLASQGHTLPALVLEWRSLSKLKSTYADGLIAAIHPQTGRVHTSFSLATTTTGRLSSSDPNLQNIPIRSENGRKIRRAFIADPGYKLVSLDYSQIELRLLAHMADVPALVDAFQKGLDIHTATASSMFGVALSDVDNSLRRKAKAINFGIIYGISSFGLAQQLGTSSVEAASYIKAYFATYPGIQDFMEQNKEFARTYGYVKTVAGRKCHIAGIQDRNLGIRQAAERQAINAPLQGSNADIIKRAMIHIPALLENTRSSVRLLLQVHDELVFEVPEAELATTVPALKKLMENIIMLKVPLVVGTGTGNNWDEAH